ncbi:MAG: YlxR family protein [Acidimicrobiia bacterium]
MGCRRSAGTGALVRFVRTGEGSLAFGPTLPGRGAWLCRATLSRCAELAQRRKAFDRALRGPVDPHTIEAAVRDAADSVRELHQDARG